MTTDTGEVRILDADVAGIPEGASLQSWLCTQLKKLGAPVTGTVVLKPDPENACTVVTWRRIE